MNAENLGTLRAAIEGDVGDLTAGIASAKKGIKGFGTDVPKWVKPVGAAFLGAGMVITGALTKMIFDTGKYGDSLDKMSLRTGVAVEDLSELSYAVKISGSDVNALETSFRFLARRMDESGEGIGIAKEAFDKLGVSVVDADGNMRDSVEVMGEVADGIVGLTAESERVAVAMDIFGARSGPQLLPLLKQGSAGIDELRKKARDLGLTMDTEAAAAAAKFEDSLTDIRESAKMASFELGSVFLPALDGALAKVTDAVGWFNRLSDSEQKIVGWGTASAGAIASVAGAGLLVVSQIPRIVAGFKVLNIASVGGAFAVTGAAIAAVASSLWAVHRITKALADPTNALRGQLEGLQTVQEGSYKAANILRDALYRLEREGINPSAASIADLGIDVDNLNEVYNTSPGILRKFAGWMRLSKVSVESVIQPTANAADTLMVLEKGLERGAKQGKALKGQIEELESAEDSAKDATDAFNEALANINKTIETGTEEWSDLTKEFKDFIAITGEGYDLATLGTIAYYETVKEKGLKTVEAERAVANTVSGLWKDWWSEAAFLTETHTIQEGEELDKRSVLDEDFLKKIQRNAVRRLGIAQEELQEESGLVKGFFDWEILAAHERSQKLISERAKQYAEESQLFDKYLADMVAGEERMLRVKEAVTAKDLDILNRGHAEAVRVEEESSRERIDLIKMYLENATVLAKRQIDTTKEYADKSTDQLVAYYTEGYDSIEGIYRDFKGYFSNVNLDMVELDKWRADQMLAIEKKLAAAKKMEVKSVFQTYSEHVMETERFWGVEKGLRIPLGQEREKSFSEMAMYYGLAEATRMRESGDLKMATMAPLPTVPQEASYQPTGTPYRARAGAPTVGGAPEFHFHIENLYGADEAFLNDLAEDIARRIKGQNIIIS